MNVLFIGCVYSQNQIELFQKKSKRGYQYAAQNFQNSLIDGLIKNNDIKLKVLTIPSLSTYPKGCKLLKIKNCPFLFEGMELGKSFGFTNIPFLNKPKSLYINKYIEEWYNSPGNRKVIIVYAMLKKQMQYAVEAKKRYPDIKLCLIVPDLPMFMGCNKYYKKLGLQKRDMQVIYKLHHEFNCYVVLAEPMLEQLNVRNKPYVIIEGIYTDTKTNIEDVKKFQRKTIMYAGGILSHYGVFDLVEAFHRIKNRDYRLMLCGPCPEIDKLNNYLRSDSRIEYKGLIPTAEVRKLQKQVTLLVNPRHSSEEFTKYSFPSKTLEYMASGTPVLMSPLPSMPEEYKQYQYLFDDESVEGMRIKIENIISKSDYELEKKGDTARQFILENKNSQKQVSHIVDMLKSI